MALTSSTRQPGLPSTEYYAPDFKVEIEGREIDPRAVRDMLEVKVTLESENLSGFSFVANNWDDEEFTFKYSDTKLFDLGNQVHVQMGYADGLKSMIKGQITKLAPRFPESGPSTINVSGQGGMLKLRDRKPKEGETKKYVKIFDWEIAQIVAQRNGLTARVTRDGEQHDLVVQKNQDDAQFLLERAKRIDFDCYVQIDASNGEEVLYFGRPSDFRDSTNAKVYVFEWGKSLINFTPELTVSRQVASVTVRGWDPAQKKTFKYTATRNDLPPLNEGGTSGPQTVEEKLGEKHEIVVDAPVTSQQEARDYAISLLRERAYRFATGSGQIIGLPELRPGDNVELVGIGKRFEGKYYITKAEHTIGSGGYTTSFDVRRPFDGGTQ